MSSSSRNKGVQQQEEGCATPGGVLILKEQNGEGLGAGLTVTSTILTA